ncbi:MAG: hypothetical protein ABIK44_06255, partial [candidate division WOR-3 bacterium]
MAITILVIWFASLATIEIFPEGSPTDGDLALQEDIESELAHSEIHPASTGNKLWTGKLLARARTDSVSLDPRPVAGFSRLDIKHGDWQVTGAIEKDNGETRIADGSAFGIQFSPSSFRTVLGDYLLGFGQGLIFSTPSNR